MDNIKGKNNSLLDLCPSNSISLEQAEAERLYRLQLLATAAVVQRVLDNGVEQVLKKLNGQKIESLSLDALEKLEEHFVGVIKVVKERKSKVIREQIEEQKEELWKRNLCKVCNVKPKSVAFVPCGHFEVCQTCADKTTVCHNCKATVKQKIPIHEV